MIKELIKKFDLSSDNRTLKKKEIFFDLGSTRKSYGPYFRKAIKKKPICIITKYKKNIKEFDVPIYYKKKLKSFFRSEVIKKYNKKPKFIYAVTGTNGKTSIAYFFQQFHKFLNIKNAAVGTIGIYENNDKKKNTLTTPDFLTNHKLFDNFFKKKINKCIIEASSHGLDQGRLDGFKFNGGIFSNLSRDHLDYHKNKKNYFQSKMILFKKLIKKNGFAILNSDINEYSQIKKIISLKKIKNISFGLNGNTIKIISLKKKNNKSILKINFLNKIYSLKINILGNFQINNFISSIICCYMSGISMQKLVNVTNKIKNPPGRMDLISNKKKKVIIDYAHTPDALKNVLIAVKNHFHKKIHLVFGCGGDRDVKKRYLMGRIANNYASKVYITDDNPRFENSDKIRKQIKKGCPKAEIIPLRNVAIQKAIKNIKNEVLIIAGKGHENYQIIKNKKKYFSDFAYTHKYLTK